MLLRVDGIDTLQSEGDRYDATPGLIHVEVGETHIEMYSELVRGASRPFMSCENRLELVRIVLPRLEDEDADVRAKG